MQNTDKQIVLLKRFYSIGDTIRLVYRLKKLDLQKKNGRCKKIEPHTNQIAPCENPTAEFNLSGHTKGFRRKTQKLELHTKQIVPCENTAEEVSFE